MNIRILYKSYAHVTTVFLCGALVGASVAYIFVQPIPPVISPLRLSNFNEDSPYTYIDPLLSIQGASSNVGEYGKLKSSVTDIISASKQNGDITTASVYFNDLVSTTGFIINPDEQYSPASLLKVPTMMVYYKLAEQQPEILNEKITYTGITDANKQEHLPSPVLLAPGQYSVQELIEHMILHSDNNAADLLINYLNKTNHESIFENLLKDLGITQIDFTNDFMTIRVYSLFFRVLYNATYLSRNDSERALKLLTKTDFTFGLNAGVPSAIPLASKFGEFTQKTQDGTLIKNELHDCGIIYYPHHPYLLCVMTKGNDFKKLEKCISSVSDAAYRFMAQHHVVGA